MVDGTPEDYPHRVEWLKNLAIGLSNRYWKTEEMHDLEEAIRFARQAANEILGGHSDPAKCFADLGDYYATDM